MDAHEIIPRLWIGNMKASTDINFIRKNYIQVVFNCTKDLPFSPMIPIKYRIPLDDNREEEEIRNMELWSGEIAILIMREYQRDKNILVHCAAGRQRSAASVAIFLISQLQMRGMDAIRFIKQIRPIAFHPYVNFGRSIDYFDRKFHGEILPACKK